MIVAELEGFRVEILDGERCIDSSNNRHFRFFFRYLDAVPERLVAVGVTVGDRLWECCQPGHFKNWSRSQESNLEQVR